MSVSPAGPSAGPAAGASSEPGAIRVRIRELAQLFNAIDPSPLEERDLNEETERFIVTWARDFPGDTPLTLSIEVGGPIAPPDAVSQVESAVRVFFTRRAQTATHELRALLRRGRTSLVIGLAFLIACVLTADFANARMPDTHLGHVLSEGLTVAGWVAMWRPMEIFLYNWWPIAGDRRLYARLANMPVQLRVPDAPRQLVTAGASLP